MTDNNGLETSSSTIKTFEDVAKTMKQNTDKDGSAEEILRARKMLRVFRYVEGRHLGYISPKAGTWVDVVPDENDPYYPNNQFKVYVRSLLKEFIKANARLSVEARPDDQDSEGAARIGKAIIELYRERVFKVTEKHAEAMFAILAGTYFRYTYWSMSLGNYTATEYDYEDQETKLGSDSLYCQSCGFGSQMGDGSSILPPASQPTTQTSTPNQTPPITPPGSQPGQAESQPIIPQQPAVPPQVPGLSDQFGVQSTQVPCPVCGEAAEYSQAPTVKVPVPVNQREVPTGDLGTDVVDPWEVKVQLRARKIAQSGYLRRVRRLRRNLLKSMFPQAKLNLGAKSDSVPLLYQAQLEASPGNYATKTSQSNITSAQDPDLLHFGQYWYEPWEYADKVFDVDFVRPLKKGTTEQQTIPAGTKYVDVYPDGMYHAFVGDELVDERNECKNKFWVVGRYFLMPTSFWGHGSEDACDQQKMLNELESVQFENAMHCTAPGVIYNPLKVAGGTLTGKPRARIPLKNPTLTDEPAKYVMYPQGRPMGGDVVNQIENKKRDLQSLFGAFSVVSGMPDVNVTTATGMAILRDQALGFLGPPLELKGEVEVEWAYQVLELVQKNMTGKRPIKTGNYVLAETEWFEASDVRSDLVITVVPDSYYPKNSLERRNDIQEAGSAFGLPLGIWNPAVPPDLRRIAAQRYDIPMDADMDQAQERKQRLEVDKMRKALEMIEQQGVPSTDQMGNPNPEVVALVASAAVPDLLIDDHQVHFAWCRRFLLSDKQQTENPVIVAAVRMHAEAHFQMADQMSMIQAAQAARAGVLQGIGQPQPEEGAPPGKPQQTSPTGGGPKPEGKRLPLARPGSTDKPAHRPGTNA